MGRRGPPRKPTELRIVQGNPGGVPLPVNEPKPERAKAAKPPVKLSRSEAKIWKSIADKLEAVGLLTVIDLRALARYCQLTVMYDKCKASLDTKPSFYIPIYDEPKKAGQKPRLRYLMQLPEVNILNQLAKELRNLEANFGMTPSARASLGANIKPPAATQGTRTSADRLFRRA